MNGIAEERRRFAWERVRFWGQETATRIQSLPIEIRTQGLSMTVAILLREDRRPSRDLLDLLETWLFEASPMRVLPTPREREKLGTRRGHVLLDTLLSLDLNQQRAYASAQQDAMALLGEAKLLASARFPSEVHSGDSH